MHVEGWHVWVGGTGALGIVIGLGKWLFSQLNGKADRSTTKILFDKIEKNTGDITELKQDTAITRTKVGNIEGAVGRIESKIDAALRQSRA